MTPGSFKGRKCYYHGVQSTWCTVADGQTGTFRQDAAFILDAVHRPLKGLTVHAELSLMPTAELFVTAKQITSKQNIYELQHFNNYRKEYFSIKLTCDGPAGAVVDLGHCDKIQRAQRLVLVVSTPEEQRDVEVDQRIHHSQNLGKRQGEFKG